MTFSLVHEFDRDAHPLHPERAPVSGCRRAHTFDEMETCRALDEDMLPQATGSGEEKRDKATQRNNYKAVVHSVSVEVAQARAKAGDSLQVKPCSTKPLRSCATLGAEEA